VVEEYIQGPSYSLEIIGGPDRYETFQVTELMMDESYNCKRVIAPATIELELIRRFEQSAKTIAQDMKLNGIMDFEVILHKEELKMLEIDARFPSQTPMAVYASTGINMVEILADLALHQELGSSFLPEKPDHAIVEHIQASPQGIEVKGESIMKTCGPLYLKNGFFGADEAVTSFVPGCSKWVATLIIKGKTSQETWEKRNQILKDLSHRFNLPLLPDINPYIFS
jgi:pyrrolysine biosynthesis protein PylC